MDLHSVMLTLHIVAGSVALMTMMMAYVTKKGPKAHAKIGRVYGMAMVAVGLTAAILFLLGASTFLLLIAFFSTYSVLVSWRFAKNRRGDIGAVDRWLLIMSAGTIATVTAFTITVFGSNVLTWLGAFVIGTPLLTWNQIGVYKGKVASSVTAMDDSTEA